MKTEKEDRPDFEKAAEEHNCRTFAFSQERT